MAVLSEVPAVSESRGCPGGPSFMRVLLGRTGGRVLVTAAGSHAGAQVLTAGAHVRARSRFWVANVMGPMGRATRVVRDHQRRLRGAHGGPRGAIFCTFL